MAKTSPAKKNGTTQSTATNKAVTAQKNIKKKFVWYKFLTWSRTLMVLVLILLVVVGLKIYNSYNNQKALNEALGVIKDVRETKQQLEKELGITLEEKPSCSQHQGLYDDAGSGWGCSIVLISAEGYDYKTKDIEAVISSQGYFVRPFRSNINKSNMGYYYSKMKSVACGTGYDSNKSYFTFRCSFGMSNEHRGRIFEELGIYK